MVSTVQLPVKPTQFIVLAVRIIVPPLCPADLIASTDHRHPLRKHQGRQHIAFLTISKFDNSRIVGWPFDSAVPTEVVVCPIAVVLAVALVMFLVVRGQVVQSEPVVRGHKVDARVRAPPTSIIEIAAAGETISQLGHLSSVPLPVAPDGISVLSVPLSPTGRKVADLVSSFPQIPRLSYEFDLLEDRVLLNRIEEST